MALAGAAVDVVSRRPHPAHVRRCAAADYPAISAGRFCSGTPLALSGVRSSWYPLEVPRLLTVSPKTSSGSRRRSSSARQSRKVRRGREIRCVGCPGWVSSAKVRPGRKSRISPEARDSWTPRIPEPSVTETIVTAVPKARRSQAASRIVLGESDAPSTVTAVIGVPSAWSRTAAS